MDALVTALTGTGGITSDSLFTSLAGAAPLIVVGVTVGFVLTIARKVVKGLGHARTGL